MPTGGFHPFPEQLGSAGEAGESAPLLQRVFESIMQAHGNAYDQSIPPTTAVGVEMLAYARAIAFDLYGGSQRLANQFNPLTMTADGLLPRWEKIFGLAVGPTDSENVRRARVAVAWGRFTQASSVQPYVDAMTALLGPIYVGTQFQTPATALSFWPGDGGKAASVTSVAGNLATVVLPDSIAGISGGYYGQLLTLGNTNAAGNTGTFPIASILSSTSVTARIVGGVSPDYGVGGTIGAPTIAWSVTNPNAPWYSTVDHISINVQQPAGYTLAQFYAAVGQIGPFLDELLPAWITWDWYVNSSHGVQEFRFDEKNFDWEAFGS